MTAVELETLRDLAEEDDQRQSFMDRVNAYEVIHGVERIKQADFNPRVLQHIVQALAKKVKGGNWSHTDLAGTTLCALDNLSDDLEEMP